MAEWRFKKLAKSDIKADPFQEEFFQRDDLGDGCDVLVREAIQNSLDAGSDGGKVIVNFTFGEADKAKTAKYFIGLFDNLKAAKLSAPEDNGFKYLVIEDFETSGLEGDVKRHQDPPEGSTEKNDFYYFWRNVGRSGKKEGDRGKWGLGKHVFPASSAVQSFLGLTRRKDDPKTYFMGQSVVGVHEIGGESRSGYGYYAEYADEEDKDFATPVEDPIKITELTADFRFKRKDHPGFSIVIPFLREIEKERLLRAVIRNYFYAILSSELEVNVGDISGEERIAPDTIDSLALKYFKGPAELAPIREAVAFARWSLTLKDSDHIPLCLPSPSETPKWDALSIDEPVLESLRKTFEQTKQLAVKIPVRVAKAGRPASSDWFYLYLKEIPESSLSGKAFFVREGISVLNAGKKYPPGMGTIGLVVIKKGPLGALLNSCENPAHDEWEPTSSKTLKKAYDKGRSSVFFVQKSIHEVYTRVTGIFKTADKDFLKNFFSIPGNPAAGPQGVPPKKELPEFPQPKKEPFAVGKVSNGFTLRSETGLPRPRQITVEVAYDTGGAKLDYDRLDFDLAAPSPGIVISYNSSEINLSVEPNRLIIEPLKDKYELKVSGFDPKRDLIVDAEGA